MAISTFALVTACLSVLLQWIRVDARPFNPLPTSTSPIVRTVHQFPNLTWIENLAFRPNGSIVVTELTRPRLWQLDPGANASQQPWLIHDFDGVLGCLGIDEIEPDVFAVAVGNFSFQPLQSIPRSYSIWRVDLNAHPPQVSKLSDLPQADFLNGMVYLPRPANSLLLADSTLGVIFRYNLTSNTADVAIDDPLMKKCSPEYPEGINGLKVNNNTVYFTNAYCGFLAALPIYPNGTAIPGTNGTQIARTSRPGVWIFDDLAVADNGAVFLATGTENVVTYVAPTGEQTIFAGNVNSTQIAEPTAMLFGNGRWKNTLFITTGGALGGPVNGSAIVGGQVLAIDVGRHGTA